MPATIWSRDCQTQITEKYHEIKFAKNRLSIKDIDVSLTKFVTYDYKLYKYTHALVTAGIYDLKLHKIAKPYFKPSSIEGFQYFTFPQLAGIFMTDEFFEVLRENDLTGVDVFDCGKGSEISLQHLPKEGSLL
jgi:hypothetical protein